MDITELTNIATNIKQIVSEIDNELILKSETFNYSSDILYSLKYIKDIEDYIAIGIDISIDIFEHIIISCYAADIMYSDWHIPFYKNKQEYKIDNNSIDFNKVLECIKTAHDNVIQKYKYYVK